MDGVVLETEEPTNETEYLRPTHKPIPIQFCRILQTLPSSNCLLWLTPPKNKRHKKKTREIQKLI
uniref:Uncharacterized protein n=1 Tax=Rhizophora mucronata TaxID=61149 RepID=A0A2P2KYE0_RHIMU